MYTILIFTLICGIMLPIGYHLLFGFDKVWRVILLAIIGLLIGAFGGALMTFALSEIALTELEINPNKTIYLESIKDNTESSGSFFLGSGSFENKMWFTYYYWDGNYIKFGKIDADKSKIKYETGLPRIETYERNVSRCSKLYNWAEVPKTDCNKKYIIYVPEGSIITEYKFDLE